MADANGGREPSCNRSEFAPETAVCKQKEERPFPGCRPEMERDLLTQTSGGLKGTEFFLAAGCPSATDSSKAEPDVSVSDAQNLISYPKNSSGHLPSNPDLEKKSTGCKDQAVIVNIRRALLAKTTASSRPLSPF